MANSKGKKNIVRNTIWGLLYKIVSLFVPFVIRTIIIRTLGIEYLGLNNLFASILQILNMTELGFGSAVVYNLYRPLAIGDNDSINALMGFYKKVYRSIGIIIAILGILLIPFLPLIISGSVPDGVSIYIIYILCLTSTVLSYLCFSYKSAILNADQRRDLIDKISMFSLLIKYCLQVIVLICSKNLYLYFSVDILTTLVINISLAILVKRRYPLLNEKGDLDKNIKQEIYTKVKGLMVYKLSGKTKNAFDSIIMSSFLGLATVAQYGNYFYIVNNLVLLISSFTSGAEAVIGNRLIIQDEETNYKDFMNLTFVHSFVSGVCCVALYCLYQHFMIMWVGKENIFPFYLVICFCIYFFLLSSCESRNAYINAAGLWWENRYKAVGSALLNLVLNLILVTKFKVLGIVVATIISVILFDFIYTSKTLFKYCFKTHSIWKYFAWWSGQLLLTMVCCVVMQFICMFISIKGLGGFIIKGIVCVIGTVFIFSIVQMKDSKFKYLCNCIKKIWENIANRI